MANVIGLSAYHEENLRKLAAYLLSGNLKAEFDMSIYSSNDKPGEHETDCGSVGCAKGHGPHAGIPKLENERWSQYALRAFGLDIKTSLWDWVFHMRWAEVDQSPEGAAKRIIYLLEYGLPHNSHDQRVGLATLCYY